MDHAIKMGGLGYKMLVQFRDFVVKDLKAPLQKAIQNSQRIITAAPAFIEAAKKFKDMFGGVKKEETLSLNVHAFMEIRDWFMSYPNMNGRRELLDSVFTLVEGELEHDPDYRFAFDIILDKYLEKMLEGKCEANDGVPNPINWPQPPPYIKEQSVTFLLIKHRKEILKIIKGER
jgi:hypothetical protein